MQRIDIKILKMRIFGLGQGTSRIQSALLLMPLAQLRQKITVEITNSLLLLFNADIEDSYNCVKTTSIQQKTIVSIQAWAELCILSIRRILPGTYQVAAKVLMMGPTNKFIFNWVKAMLGNKAVQNTFSCAFPIFRDLFQNLRICLRNEFFLGRRNLRRPRTIPFLGPENMPVPKTKFLLGRRNLRRPRRNFSL